MVDLRDIYRLVEKEVNRETFRELNWTGSFSDYLEMAMENPKICRNAYQFLFDMILSYGFVEYKREILPGDLVQVRCCFIGFTARSLHLWGVMIDPVTDEICAVNDQVCVHFDTVARRAVPWPDEIFKKGRSLVRERPEI